MKLTDKIKEAKLILVPKGDDSTPCLRAFEEAAGIKVPRFGGRKLEARAGGRTFIKVKGRDIPRLVAAGYGDVGLTGSDSCEEFDSSSEVAYQTCGPRMCRFVLLAPRGTAATVRERLKKKAPVPVATSFPRLLVKCARRRKLCLVPGGPPVSGSLEIMPRLLDVPLVADLVSTGTTAKANNLVEIETLLDVYPAIVVKTGAGRKKGGYEGIDRIDATLARRTAQINDQTVNSPTLGLLRDPNLAGKKAGEELAEVLMAAFGPGTVRDCEGEIADSIYTQLVAARSRGKPVELGNVIRVLIDRNAKGAER